MKETRNPLAVGAGLVLALASLTACGGAQIPALPDPGPSATPAPAATPTPTPNPGSIGAYACPLPPSSNPDAFGGPGSCPEVQPRLSNYVNAAIDKAQRDHPELFNFNDMAGPSPRVLDRAAYHRVVAENLVQSGVCTIIEKEEIAIKNVNDFNEQWNIYTSAGFVRRRYVTTCSPSWF
jgi:hypothetical protein